MKKQCFNKQCGAVLEPKKRLYCSRCRIAVYCNAECQRVSWRTHKPECRKIEKIDPEFRKMESAAMAVLIDRCGKPASAIALRRQRDGRRGGVFINLDHQRIIPQSQKTVVLEWYDYDQLLSQSIADEKQVAWMKQAWHPKAFFIGVISNNDLLTMRQIGMVPSE